MSTIFEVQGWIQLVLGVAALAIQVWALVDAAMTRADAFVATGKRTKQFWVVVTGIAALIGFVFFTNPFNIFSLIGIVAAAIYLTDVRPAVAPIRGGRRGSGSSGPYGPW